jgi:hypothetical protein
MMIRLTFSSLFATAAMVVLSSAAQAQIYVPHTTTHIDLVPHNGHFDAVPHTTTHFDAVPFPSHSSHFGSGYGLGYNTGFGSSYNYNSGYRSYYAPQYNSFNYSTHRPRYQNSYQHSSTHLDIVPHRGHYHVVPHTTTHRHRF